MFTYNELSELEDLCKQDVLFEKYIERFREENNRLLSKVTHEIGNPLTIIYSTIQLMETKDPAVRELTYWEQLKDDIKGLSLLLHDYSDYSNCDSLNMKAENLTAMIERVKNSFEPMITRSQINLSVEIPEDMMSAMEAYPCDGVKLKQVFVNIIKNGIEALGQGGSLWICVPKAGTQVEELIQGDKYLILKVGNNGSKIPDSEMKGIFSPLISSKLGGSGIGLSISNKIIEAHGGMIFVNSLEEQTEFTICLPL